MENANKFEATTMNKILAIVLRKDMIDGKFDLDENTTAFMKLVREKLAQAAAEIVDGAPATCDVGRLIAALDAIQHAKNLLCDSSILGCEAETRKKRKAESEAPDTGKE